MSVAHFKRASTFAHSRDRRIFNVIFMDAVFSSELLQMNFQGNLNVLCSNACKKINFDKREIGDFRSEFFVENT